MEAIVAVAQMAISSELAYSMLSDALAQLIPASFVGRFDVP